MVPLATGKVLSVCYDRRSMCKRPAPKSEIEITPEMIEAAAKVLWSRDLLQIGEGLAMGLASEMLERALAARFD